MDGRVATTEFFYTHLRPALSKALSSAVDFKRLYHFTTAYDKLAKRSIIGYVYMTLTELEQLVDAVWEQVRVLLADTPKLRLTPAFVERRARASTGRRSRHAWISRSWPYSRRHAPPAN